MKGNHVGMSMTQVAVITKKGARFSRSDNLSQHLLELHIFFDKLNSLFKISY